MHENKRNAKTLRKLPKLGEKRVRAWTDGEGRVFCSSAGFPPATFQMERKGCDLKTRQEGSGRSF